MLVSQSHQFVFVHMPRTGGTSIRQILTPYSTQGHSGRVNKLCSRLGLVPWNRRYFPIHTTLRQAETILPKPMYKEYFKFGFVRNPWERMASHYQVLLHNSNHRRHQKVRSLPDFEAYLAYEARRGKVSQADALTNKRGEIGLDFLGRFENLATDFSDLCARIGIEAELPNLNQANPNGYDWREMYTSNGREIVAKHWGQEIEMFDYAFDESNESRN